MFIPNVIAWMLFYTCLVLVLNFILMFSMRNSSAPSFTNIYQKRTFKLIVAILAPVTAIVLYYTFAWTRTCQYEFTVQYYTTFGTAYIHNELDISGKIPVWVFIEYIPLHTRIISISQGVCLFYVAGWIYVLLRGCATGCNPVSPAK